MQNQFIWFLAPWCNADVAAATFLPWLSWLVREGLEKCPKSHFRLKTTLKLCVLLNLCLLNYSETYDKKEESSSGKFGKIFL